MNAGIRRMRLALIVVAMLAAPHAIQADDEPEGRPDPEQEQRVQVGLGAALIILDEPYRGLKDEVDVLGIPLISVETKRLSWQGPRLAYKIVDKQTWAFDLVAAWRFYGVDPDDSDFLEGMQERKATLDAGVQVVYNTERTRTEMRAAVDTLDRHNGFDLSLDFGLPQRLGRWVVTPNLGLNYLDENFIDYYFGVAPDEATPVRPEYAANDALNIVLGIEAFYPINQRWIFIGGLRHEWLDSGITDSPIVEDDTRSSIFAGVSRRFGRTGRPRPSESREAALSKPFRSARR